MFSMLEGLYITIISVHVRSRPELCAFEVLLELKKVLRFRRDHMTLSFLKKSGFILNV